jgi:hypothetical protein
MDKAARVQVVFRQGFRSRDSCDYRFLAQGRKPLTLEWGRAAGPLIWRALPNFVRQRAFGELWKTGLYRTAAYQRGPVSFTAFGGHWSGGQPAIEVMARSEDCQTVLLAEYFWTQWPVGPGPIHAFVRPAR